jgi:hypothetical protein
MSFVLGVETLATSSVIGMLATFLVNCGAIAVLRDILGPQLINAFHVRGDVNLVL